jgi:hypothetical protein
MRGSLRVSGPSLSGSLLLSVRPSRLDPYLDRGSFAQVWTQDFFESAQLWRDAGCVDEMFKGHRQRRNL